MNARNNLLESIYGFASEAADAETCLIALINCSVAINGQKKMKSSELIQAICTTGNMGWATYNDGNPIRPDQLDSLLKSFGFKSIIIKFDSGKEKGYYGKWFSDRVTQIKKPLPSMLVVDIQKPIAMDEHIEKDAGTCLIALMDCANIIEGLSKIKLTEIVTALCSFNKEQWATYDNGKPINPELLDSMLNKCGIVSMYIEFNDGFEMGYYGKSFSERVTLVSEMPERDNPTIKAGDHELMLIPKLSSIRNETE